MRLLLFALKLCDPPPTAGPVVVVFVVRPCSVYAGSWPAPLPGACPVPPLAWVAAAVALWPWPEAVPVSCAGVNSAAGEESQRSSPDQETCAGVESRSAFADCVTAVSDITSTLSTAMRRDQRRPRPRITDSPQERADGRPRTRGVCLLRHHRVYLAPRVEQLTCPVFRA